MQDVHVTSELVLSDIHRHTHAKYDIMWSNHVLCNLAIDNETNDQMQNFNYLGYNVAGPVQLVSTLSLADCTEYAIHCGQRVNRER